MKDDEDDPATTAAAADADTENESLRAAVGVTQGQSACRPCVRLQVQSPVLQTTGIGCNESS